MRSAIAPSFLPDWLARQSQKLALALIGALVLAAPASAVSTFYVRGGGYGHGIGMSQYGSYGFALHGKNYRWILSHYYQGTALGHTDPAQIVRVLLSTGQAAFAGATRAGGSRLNPGNTYTVSPNADGTLSLIGPKGKRFGHFTAPLSAAGPGPLQLSGHGGYRGSLEFRPDGSGGVQTVDALGLDDYVRGVISWEMPAGWAPQALEVQAVAARTYAITTTVGGNGYDLYPDTRSQMYGGVAAETPATDAAVAATSGQVVIYDGAPVVTYFFSSSGGHTENIENVWPGATPEPWLEGVGDPYDGAAGNPYHRWGQDLTLAAAAQKLGGYLKGSLIGIAVTRHGSSPRILTANVVGTGGTTQVTGGQLQSAFGLMTTYAWFTTITTLPGPAAATPARDARALPSGGAGSNAIVALVPLVNTLVASSVPALHGSVFPGHRGQRYLVQQQQASGGWSTVQHGKLGPNGRYSAQLPGAGTYRIVFAGIDGPALSVG